MSIEIEYLEPKCNIDGVVEIDIKHNNEAMHCTCVKTNTSLYIHEHKELDLEFKVNNYKDTYNDDLAYKRDVNRVGQFFGSVLVVPIYMIICTTFLGFKYLFGLAGEALIQWSGPYLNKIVQ